VARKGMELLLEAGAEAVGIFGDSKLVISQLTEEYRCKSNLLFRYGYNVKSLWPNLGT
jgi:ribonuclease HI